MALTGAGSPSSLLGRMDGCDMEVQGNKALGGDGGGRFDEVAFIDVEVGVEDGRIHDYGACQGANRELHTALRRRSSRGSQPAPGSSAGTTSCTTT